MLHIHRAERSDRLVGALADVLREPLADPLATEVVAVHSRGIERWIAQELATRLGVGSRGADGVAANIDFPFPMRLVGDVLATTTGTDPDEDPWHPDRLVWSLLELVATTEVAPASLGPLAAHLGDAGGPSNRRFAALRHVADLFDRYGVHRPEMLRAWLHERDVGADGEPLRPDLVWQPRLWRAVNAYVGRPSPAQRLARCVEVLRSTPRTVELPERIALFGLTAIPASSVEVLEALALHRDVHLLLLHSSPVLWDAIRERTDGATLPLREHDPTREAARHPIVRSWGRDAREMQLVLSSGDRASAPSMAPRVEPERRSAGGSQPLTLLGRLQRDIVEDRPLPALGAERPALDEHDRSVQIHGCHGRTRQVEVLRDAVLHALADDPTLEPRDIIVMCPDIEDFAPLIEAVFGAQAVADDDRPGRPDLRVRLADRSIRRTNPLLRVVADLLDLADGRLTASEVLDLATREPVRDRFGFDDDAVERLEAWVADLNVRWGIDGAHRAEHDLPPIDANSWRAGLDRLLLGVAMADEEFRLVGDTAPYDGIEGTDVDLGGRFVEFVERLADAVASLRAGQPIGAWRGAITAVADALTATRFETRWQRVQLANVLDDVVAEASRDGVPSAVPLSLAEVRSLLADRLAGRPSRAGQRTGDLVVCTLVPMRSVPHRLVCLLGLDDESFPRRSISDSDDLVDRAPRVGDRDPRSEDRQLLLDAVLAATEQLIVTYRARDERTNEPRPPAVPLGELCDVIDRSVRTSDGGPASERITIHHPLQPFDARNYRDGMLGVPGPWSFDADGLDAARASLAEREPAPAFLTAPLTSADDADTIELRDLIAFLAHPVKAFVRTRMQVSLPSSAEEPSDAIPIDLDGLAKWEVGQRFIDAAIAGHERDHVIATLRARGVLPPGALADEDLSEITATTDSILALAADHGAKPGAGETLDVTVDLDDGRTIVGAISGVRGAVATALRYSRLGAKHRLESWVHLLAATVAQPDRDLTVVTAGRRQRGGDGASVSVLTGTSHDDARMHLQRLVALYDRGLCEPLPLPCDTALACLESILHNKPPDAYATKRWEATPYRSWSENADDYHVLAFGRALPFADLARRSVRDDERSDALAALVSRAALERAEWLHRKTDPPPLDLIADEAKKVEAALLSQIDQDSRLLHLAASLWHPLVSCETVKDLS
ncbi:MAG: exodeoxyribonuclease V subunit gamma [Actinobacteria bacterium]|nr:exodeoxyribonuclease V subunit gamma [Actinomycetota bacterium]